MNAVIHVRAALGAALALALLLVVMPPADASGTGHAVAHQARALQEWRGTATTELAQAAGAQGLSWAGDDDVVPGSLLITTAGDADLQSFAAAGYAHGRTIAPGVTAIEVDPADELAVVDELIARDDVVAVEPNRLRQFFAAPDDALYHEQWAHQVTGIESAWDRTTGSTDVLIAVADSGVVADHPDLGGNITEQVDASTGEVTPGSSDNDPCQVGHGTWVAGVVGALGNNGTGVAGTNWNVSILDINTADPNVTCAGPTDIGTIASIAYATQQGADVVNLSLGGPADSCPASLQSVIDDARTAGTLVVAASGNAGNTVPNVPASCNGVISVGATGPDNALADYSTTNPFVDVVAPGGAGTPDGDPAGDVLTTSWWAQGARTPEYVAVAGTSFAAPYVSGLVGLMKAVNADLSVADIESLLQHTAMDLGEEGRDDQHGFGLVQADVVAAAEAGGDIPAPAPGPDFPVDGDLGEPTDPNRPGGDVPAIRIAAGTGVTEPITQAVAVSQAVFVDAGVDSLPAARWGIVARDDDYADALAGSSLTFGVAPLLFTGNTGPLAEPTAAELTRTLEPGADVYLLGGVNALPAALDAEIAALGFTPVRLAGLVREATAATIADTVDELLIAAGLPPARAAIVVNRQEWPDAIAAGQMGAQFAMPILLTPADELNGDTAEALRSRELEELYIVGGTVRVEDATMQAALGETGLDGAIRLAGEERNGTVVAVSAAVESILARTPVGRPTNSPIVNMRRDDAYAHMLSATVPLGFFTGVFLPVEEDGGSTIPDVTTSYAAGLGLPLNAMGDADLITDETIKAMKQIVDTAGSR